MRILGVNGIRSDGAASTDRLLAELRRLGHETVDINYPRVGFLSARWRWQQKLNAGYILDMHRPGDAVVAHSYGCLLALRAMELGALFSQVFYFGAALNDDFSFPFLGMKRLWNVHQADDRAVALGSLLLRHDFGPMGQTGYGGKPPDPRIVNVPATGHQVTEPLRHSDYFLNGNLLRWAEFIDGKLRAEAADG